jgi:hypothetical protein
MTKPIPFTEATVRRAIAAVQKAGLAVAAVRIEPDGAVTIFQHGIASPLPSDETPSTSKWLDVEA